MPAQRSTIHARPRIFRSTRALPFALEVRQALVILAFSPIGSAAPAFTAELKEDAGLASAVNSICILCSIVIMVVLLSVMLY